jgi:hypothetical protein
LPDFEGVTWQKRPHNVLDATPKAWREEVYVRTQACLDAPASALESSTEKHAFVACPFNTRLVYLLDEAQGTGVSFLPVDPIKSNLR